MIARYTALLTLLSIVAAHLHHQEDLTILKFRDPSFNLRTHLKTHLGNQTNLCQACQNCTKAFQEDLREVEPFMNDLMNATEELCKLIGGKPVVQECQKVVEDFRHDYHWLADVATPLELCQEMKLCNSTFV